MKISYLRVLAALLIALFFFTFVTEGPVAGYLVLFGASLVIHNLRPKQPSGHLYTWTGVSIADLFIPQVYAAIQPNDSPELTAFVQSGVAVSNPVLVAAANSGTKKIEIPLWGDLDSSVAPNLTDDTDTLASPGKVGVSDLNARNAYLNKGYGAADLAVELSKTTPGNGSPMTRIKNRFGTYWMRQFQYRVIAACRGILAANIANNSGDMLNNIALETTVGVTSANKVSANAVIGAVFTMGDHWDLMKVIAMHSVVYQNLISQQLITFIRDAEGKLMYNTYLGLRVVVDDGLPVIAGTTSGFKYVTVIFGDNAIGYGEGTPNVPAEAYRLPLAGNGGGTESIWERKTWMIHPYGWDWLEGSVAGESATLAELRLAANWNRVLSRKQVPMAYLQTNG